METCSEEQHSECLKLLQRLRLKSSERHMHDSCNSQTANSPPDSALHDFNLPPAWPVQNSEQAGKLAMQTTQHEGRQLVAAQTLTAGVPIWTELPFAHVLYRQHIKQVAPKACNRSCESSMLHLPCHSAVRLTTSPCLCFDCQLGLVYMQSHS